MKRPTKLLNKSFSQTSIFVNAYLVIAVYKVKHKTLGEMYYWSFITFITNLATSTECLILKWFFFMVPRWRLSKSNFSKCLTLKLIEYFKSRFRKISYIFWLHLISFFFFYHDGLTFFIIPTSAVSFSRRQLVTILW